jgi:hypothetical protein
MMLAHRKSSLRRPPERKARGASTKGRLGVALGGLSFLSVGIIQLYRNVQVVVGRRGIPVFSWGMIAAGGVCILLSIVPVSWIAKAANLSLPRKERHQ